MPDMTYDPRIVEATQIAIEGVRQHQQIAESAGGTFKPDQGDRMIKNVAAIAGIDYDDLTEADVAFIRKQMQAGGAEEPDDT